MAIVIASAKAVLAEFSVLPNEEKDKFIDLLSACSNADTAFRFIRGLSHFEKGKFSDLFTEKQFSDLFAVMLREACRIAKENPTLSEDELMLKTGRTVADAQKNITSGVAEFERTKFKEEREKKSGSETIQRNIEMIELDECEPEKWSNRKLAEKYGVDEAYVRRVLKERDKWKLKERESQ